jgi:hypothetical protein
MILKKMSNIQPYFPALLGGATTALSGIPYKSFSSARRDRKYYSWMRVAWHKADENDDQSAAEKLRSEFNAIRQSNFGKG